MAFIIPLEIVLPLALVVAILITVLWYLYNKNKIIYKKIVSEKTRLSRYKKGIENLKNNPGTPEKDFKILSKYVRTFFKEYLNLQTNLTYLELAKKFEKQKKPDYVNLSNLMSNIKYKGQKTPENIQQAIEIFSKIMKEY